MLKQGLGGEHGLVGALRQLKTIGRELFAHRQTAQGFCLPDHGTAQMDKCIRPLASAMSTARSPRRHRGLKMGTVFSGRSGFGHGQTRGDSGKGHDGDGGAV